jgi:hypothetical protein
MNVSDQTPNSLARRIINLLDWELDEVALEPARGEGAFYDNLSVLAPQTMKSKNTYDSCSYLTNLPPHATITPIAGAG